MLRCHYRKKGTSVMCARVREGRKGIDYKGPYGSLGHILPAGVFPDVRRADQVEACLQGLAESHLVAICAASGMGKTALARQVAAEFGGDATPTSVISVDGLTGKRVIQAMKKESRVLKRRCTTPLLVVDDVPSLDDYDVEHVAHAIHELMDSGTNVLLVLRPESEQIIEALGDVCVLTSSDLLVRSDELSRWGGLVSESESDEVLALTGGIPALVNEARHVGVPDGGSSMDFTGLPALVCTCLRRAIMEDERAMRLAMILLGHGTVSEVESCVRRFDHDIFRSLRDEEPLVGVGNSFRTFRCVGAISDAEPIYCEEGLKAVSEELQDVVTASARVLLERGDAARAGFALRCCAEPAKRDDTVLSWPGSLINCGELDMVRDAVRRPDGVGAIDPDRLSVAASMVLSVEGRADEAEDALSGVADTARLSLQVAQARALLAACLLGKGRFDPELSHEDDGSPWVIADDPKKAPDKMTRALRRHVLVRLLCLRGRVEDAYRCLLIGSERTDEQLYSSALLCEDATIVGGLMGDVPSLRGTSSHERSLDFLMSGGFGDELVYQIAERESLMGITGQVRDGDQADRALRVASRRGDALVQAYVMVLKALGDIARGSNARAVVLLEQALRETKDMDVPYLRGVSKAARILVGLCVGEEMSEEAQDATRDEKGAVPELEVMAEVARHRRGGSPRRIATHERCPASALPFMMVAACLCGKVSERVRSVLPEGWVRDIDDFATRWEGLGEEVRPVVRAVERRRDDLLDIHMLGGFMVRSRGKDVPDDSWRRRAARTLLELLMIIPQHEVTRELACEVLWPQSDLYTARNNIYAVLTSLRKAIGQKKEGPQFIVADGGVIRVDQDLLHCDLDDFRQAATSVLAEGGDDLRCIRECCELEGRYTGNIAIPPSDPTGIFSKCHRDVAGLYSDAMVAGSEAAMRLGKATVSVRLARNAANIDPLREDVEECVVRALITAGRTREARFHYESYARKIISSMGVPPSSRLRRMVKEMCGQVSEGRAGRLEEGLFREE